MLGEGVHMWQQGRKNFSQGCQESHMQGSGLGESLALDCRMIQHQLSLFQGRKRANTEIIDASQTVHQSFESSRWVAGLQ